MKKITLLIMFVITFVQVNAQVSSYSFSQSTGTYTPITGGTVLGTTTSDDQRFIDPAVPAGGTTTTGVGFPIGFNFVFNGIVFDRVAINNNGWISLGQSALTPAINNASTSGYDPLSSAAAIIPSQLRSRIAAYGDDLQGQAGSVLRIETIGVAPNRVLVVQWAGYREYGSTGQNLNFQIRLNETTNVVEVVYGTMIFSSNVETAQIGLGGNVDTDFNNRTTTTDWNATIAGTVNNSSCTYSTTVTAPASGLTFTWTPPSCSAPNGFVASAITANSATIAWNAPNPVPSTGYEYYYSDVNTPPAGAGTSTTALTANLSPLNPATVYYVWLRSDCGGIFSAWNGPFTFTTNCVAVTDFIQNFDGVTSPAMPVCFTKVGTTGTVNTQTANPFSPTNTLYVYSSSGTNKVVVKLQPVSNLGAGTHRLRFKMRANSTVGGIIEVGYLTNSTDATSFVSLGSVTATSLTYADYVVTPTAGVYTENLAIRHTGVPANSVLIDDITWEPIPVTPPTCSTISTPANNALNIALATNISWAANVDATGYYLQIGYSSGGSEILVNTDLGNVLTYNPPVDFDYSTTYFVTLTPYNANGIATGCTETTFTTRDEPLVGALCSNPIIIDPSALPYTTTDNTNLYEDDYSTGAPCSNATYMTGDDVVYTISPATNMSVDILLSNLTAAWSGIHVMDGCPGTSPNCIAFMGNSGTSNRDLQDVLLTGGTTYYIVISTNAAPQSVGYTLTITENTCISPSVSFSSPNNCPTTNFNAVANITNLGSATSLTVTDNQGNPSQNVTATGNVTFGPYPFGTNVVLTVTNDQDGTCNVVSSNLTVAACPPSNDDCADAIVLTPGGVFATYQDAADNTAATGSSQTAPTCANYAGQDVWYTVTVPASGSITIETASDTGSPITDTGLAVYSGTCAGVTQIGCSDDEGTGAFSLVSLTGRTPGEVLLVRAWEYGGGTEGTFLISAYDASLSSSSFDNNSFMVYPNPVKDVLNLSYTSEISNVQVINMLGQVVLDRKMNATEGQIDMTGLNSGAYIVNVTVGDTVKAIKVIKQ